MNIELLFDKTKYGIDQAEETLSAGDFDLTLRHLAQAYADVRALIDAVWNRKRSKKLEANPPGENVQ